MLGDAPGVVDVVDGAAAALHAFGHALVPGKAALVPQLQREANELVTLGVQQRGNRRGVDATGHGYSDRVVVPGFRGGHGGPVFMIVRARHYDGRERSDRRTCRSV